jgi:hypothetical protein
MASETKPEDMHEWKVTTDATADATNVGNFLKVRRGSARPRAPHFGGDRWPIPLARVAARVAER